MEIITYVTYDENGNLTGFYIQPVRPEHEAAYIEVDDTDGTFWSVWVNYRANDARDGIELSPPPETPPAE